MNNINLLNLKFINQYISETLESQEKIKDLIILYFHETEQNKNEIGVQYKAKSEIYIAIEKAYKFQQVKINKAFIPFSISYQVFIKKPFIRMNDKIVLEPQTYKNKRFIKDINIKPFIRKSNLIFVLEAYTVITKLINKLKQLLEYKLDTILYTEENKRTIYKKKLKNNGYIKLSNIDYKNNYIIVEIKNQTTINLQSYILYFS